MKFTKRFIVSVALCAMSFGSASGEIVSNVNPGVTQVTTGVSTFATFGNDMVGMKVTAFFADGSMETIDWAAYGSGNNGRALGTNWYLRFTGDDGSGTYNDFFKLKNETGLTLTGFKMDGGPGLTVFDRTFGGQLGTEGSRRGRDFYTNSSLADSGNTVTADYSDIVRLTGNSPIGDLYRTLSVDLGNGNAGLASGKRFYFRQDTDNVFDLTAVPEPSSFAMFSLLIAGSVMSSRRRRDSKI